MRAQTEPLSAAGCECGVLPGADVLRTCSWVRGKAGHLAGASYPQGTTNSVLIIFLKLGYIHIHTYSIFFNVKSINLLYINPQIQHVYHSLVFLPCFWSFSRDWVGARAICTPAVSLGLWGEVAKMVVAVQWVCWGVTPVKGEGRRSGSGQVLKCSAGLSPKRGEEQPAGMGKERPDRCVADSLTKSVGAPEQAQPTRESPLGRMARARHPTLLGHGLRCPGEGELVEQP